MDNESLKTSYEVLIQYGAIGAILVYGLVVLTAFLVGMGIFLRWAFMKAFAVFERLVDKHMSYLDESMLSFKNLSESYKEQSSVCSAKLDDHKTTIEEVLEEVRGLKELASRIDKRVEYLTKKLEAGNVSVE